MIKLCTAAILALSFFQTPIAAPVLSELQQAQLQTALLKVEVATYKHAQAERDLNDSIDTLQRMLADLHRPGYELDTQTMRYRPVPKRDQ